MDKKGIFVIYGGSFNPPLNSHFSLAEYVLNNDQAWNLLHNFSTLKIPEFTKTNNPIKQSKYMYNRLILFRSCKKLFL